MVPTFSYLQVWPFWQMGFVDKTSAIKANECNFANDTPHVVPTMWNCVTETLHTVSDSHGCTLTLCAVTKWHHSAIQKKNDLQSVEANESQIGGCCRIRSIKLWTSHQSHFSALFLSPDILIRKARGMSNWDADRVSSFIPSELPLKWRNDCISTVNTYFWFYVRVAERTAS